ncbi:MAG: hypothetical protein LBT05_10985 [Planctomycetaceae bacterium]|jgi:sulfatase maturation enzyme AslB (radical SAM superfamily)|nr:hypothetical protein [Planctomycetaceae bacterium]
MWDVVFTKMIMRIGVMVQTVQMLINTVPGHTWIEIAVLQHRMLHVIRHTALPRHPRTRDVADYISENNFILFVSLDGWREMHNANRPCLDGIDRFDIILENAIYADKIFRKKKLPKVKVRANLTHDFPDIKKVADFLESQGFTYIGIGPIEPLPHGDGCGMSLTEEQLDQLSEKRTEMLLEVLVILPNVNKQTFSKVLR